MQIFISTADPNTFKHNGLTYPRNFMCIKQGATNVAIHNAYDTRQQLLGSTPYSQIQVNGTVYGSQAALMTALSPLLFVKNFNYVIQSNQATQLVSIGDITVSGNTVTIEPAEWLINGITYQTVSDTILTVPYAATGLTRVDIIVADFLGQIIRIEGNETDGIAVAPIVPLDCVYISQLTVNDNTIGTPSTPITGGLFVEKAEYSENLINDSGSVVLDLNSLSTAFRFVSGDVDTVLGFNATTDFLGNILYVGKEVRIVNSQSNPMTLTHAGTGLDIAMSFPDGNSLEIQPNEVAVFKLVKTSAILAEFVSLNRVVTAASTLQQVTDIGNTTTNEIVSDSGTGYYTILSSGGLEGNYGSSGGFVLNSAGFGLLGATGNIGIIHTDLVNDTRNYQFPDASGIIPLTVNGISANTVGNIVVPSFTLTSSGITSVLGYTPISADTNTYITGGTYSAGTLNLNNSTGGITSINGFFNGISGTTNAVPKFLTGNTLGNSFFYDGGAVVGGGYSTGTSSVSFIRGGNSWLRLERAQSNVDFILGNPGSDQPNLIQSTNTIDGFRLYSTGSLSLFGGTTYEIGTQHEGLRVLTGGTVMLPTIPLTGTTSDAILVRDLSGNVKTISVSAISPVTTYITGGTYLNGTTTITNSTGGTISITGYTTGFTLASSGITTALGYVPYDKAGGDLTGTAGAGYLGLPSQASTPSTPASGLMKVFADTTGRFTWLTNLGFTRTFRSASLTGNRVYTLQDRDGTLVDDTDLATKLALTGGTVSGGITANTLSATTLFTPSGNVQTQIDNRIKVIVKDATTSTGVNNSTSETILTSYLVPANTFSTNDVFNLVAARFKSGGLGGTIEYKIYINTGNTLTGAVKIAGISQGSFAHVTSKIGNLTYSIYGGNLEGQFGSTTTGIDTGVSGTALLSTPFNVAVNNYVIVTATCSTSNNNNARQTILYITN
jgi:hypothetical protein